MSTAYPPRLIRYMLSSQKEREAAKSCAIPPGFYGDFPPRFGLYYVQPGSDYLSQTFTLSSIDLDGQAEDVIYPLIFHKGPGARQTTLFSGPDADTPLAVGNNEKRFGSSAILRLPAASKESDPWNVRLKYSGIGSNMYSFEFEGDVFEWLEESMSRPRTRRLVRRSPAKFDSESAIGNALVVWTEGSVPNKYRQLAVFRLVDETVAQILGERWMLLAVSTALVICQQGAAVEGTMTWHEEKMLEKGAHRPQ